MRYIVPTPITDSMLVSSSVPEDEHPAWSAPTAYSLGARVIYAHAIYERLVPGTTATAPDVDAANWVRLGPTNRWAMLDGAVGTATQAIDTLTVVLRPGQVRGLALLDMDVESVRVTMTVGDAVIYDTTVDPLATQEECDEWFGYFFETIQRRRVVTINDLPPFGEGEITIALQGTGLISVGTLVVGAMYGLGNTLANPRIGIVDYSRKVTDEFGVTSVAQRAYSRRMSVEVLLPTSAVDVTSSRLARIRAQPVVWIGSDRLDGLVVYGFVKDWSIAIPGQVNSTCSLEIEGLV